MKKTLAIILTKILILVGKILGKKSSSAPGLYAMKICPEILNYLSRQIKKDIIVVCGTNGKTTTNNLINSLITSNGHKTVCNIVGANMLPGIVTAFVEKANIFGKLDADYACLEIDEMSAVKVFEHLLPDYIVVNNLFRDQLDRYGEVEITLSYIEKAISMCNDVKLILNGDDPIVSSLALKTNKEAYYFGVGENIAVKVNENKEGRFCVFCGEELNYEFCHYSQLGKYRCNKCGYKRPEIDFEALNVDMSDALAFCVKNQHFNVNYRGFYNIYNILAAYSVITVADVHIPDINKTLQAYKPQIGRMELFNINGKKVILNLAKNPAGFNQAISTVMSDTRLKNIIVAVNDKPSDGRDISWIWDVDFEIFKSINANKIYLSGIRHNDLAVRFKYAEIENFEDCENIKEAILKGLKEECDIFYLLVNYTMLFDTQNILKGLEGDK